MDPSLAFSILYESQYSNIESKRLFIQCSQWYNSLYGKESKQIQSILGYINISVDDPSKRWESLCLLKALLAQVSKQVFADNYQRWVLRLWKIVLHDDDKELRLEAMKILGEVLQIARADLEQQRYLTSSFAPHAVPPLLELDEHYELVVAHGLSYLLKSFPGPCRQHSFGIQKRLFRMLSSRCFDVIEVSATCISYLPCIENVGDNTKKQPLTWSELYSKYCASLTASLNTLYENVEIDQPTTVSDSEQVPFSLTVDDAEISTVFVDAYRRASTICLCLRKLLSNGDSSTARLIPVEKTLQLIHRILKTDGVDSNMKSVGGSQDESKILLAAVIPMLHVDAYVLLETLILRKLRGVVYRVMEMWLYSVPGTDFSHLGFPIIQQLLKNVAMKRECPKPIGNKKTAPSSKASKRFNLEMSSTNTKQERKCGATQSETCLLALNVLRAIMCNVADDISAVRLEVAYGTVSGNIARLQATSDDKLDPPYSDVHCQRALYRTLASMLTAPTRSPYTLLSKSVSLFTKGKNASDVQTRQICTEALSTCRLMVESHRCRLLIPGLEPESSAVQTSTDMDDEGPEEIDLTVDVRSPVQREPTPPVSSGENAQNTVAEMVMPFLPNSHADGPVESGKRKCEDGVEDDTPPSKAFCSVTDAQDPELVTVSSSEVVEENEGEEEGQNKGLLEPLGSEKESVDSEAIRSPGSGVLQIDLTRSPDRSSDGATKMLSSFVDMGADEEDNAQ